MSVRPPYPDTPSNPTFSTHNPGPIQPRIPRSRTRKPDSTGNGANAHKKSSFNCVFLRTGRFNREKTVQNSGLLSGPKNGRCWRSSQVRIGRCKRTMGRFPEKSYSRLFGATGHVTGQDYGSTRLTGGRPAGTNAHPGRGVAGPKEIRRGWMTTEKTRRRDGEMSIHSSIRCGGSGSLAHTSGATPTVAAIRMCTWNLLTRYASISSSPLKTTSRHLPASGSI